MDIPETLDYKLVSVKPLVILKDGKEMSEGKDYQIIFATPEWEAFIIVNGVKTIIYHNHGSVSYKICTKDREADYNCRGKLIRIATANPGGWYICYESMEQMYVVRQPYK